MKKQTLILEIIPTYIVIFMPVLLITGPFLSDLGVSIVSILFLINSKKNNLLKYYNNIYFKVFVIFWMILIISSLLSNNILVSLKNSLFYFRFGIFSLCLWYLIEKNINIIKYIFYSIIICFLALIIDGYFQFFFGKNLFGIELYREYRVSSFFGSELILGSYLSRFFPILFALFLFIDQKLLVKNKRLLFFISIIFILVEGLIILSGERLSLFFTNLSAIFIILMINDYRRYRFWTYVGSLLFIFILLFSFPIIKQRIIDQTINDFTKKNEGGEKIYIFSKSHNDMYISATRIFFDNKFFGVGPRQFRNICNNYSVSKYSCETHPHNTYLELLAEAGIFAFLIVAVLFLLIIFLVSKQFFLKLFNSKKRYFNDFQLCLLNAIIISIWPFSPSGSFFNNWLSIVYFFPIGIFLWSINNENKSN
jgi:O-antigen ligase